MKNESSVPISPVDAKKTAMQYLYSVVHNPEAPLQAKLDASKALLPYTAKKVPERSENTNRNFNVNVSDDRLAKLSDEQIDRLIDALSIFSEPADTDGREDEEAV